MSNKLPNNTLKKVANLFEDALKMGHDYTRNWERPHPQTKNSIRSAVTYVFEMEIVDTVSFYNCFPCYHLWQRQSQEEKKIQRIVYFFSF